MKTKAALCVALSALALLTVAGCSNAKKQMGLTRSAPDEFAVVKRAPLSMPPDYALQRPRPGAPRPQEQTTTDQAKQTIFGETSGSGSVAPGDGESVLLSKAGATNTDPSIRQRVDVETEKLSKENIPVARKLFGLGGDPNTAPTSVVNPKAESERLQQNKEQGKPVTAGVTPTTQK